MGNRDKARAAIYGMMGGYLLYLAYKLFTSQSGAEGSESAVMLIFGIFFVIVGAAALVLAFYMSRKKVSHDAEAEDGKKIENSEEPSGKRMVSEIEDMSKDRIVPEKEASLEEKGDMGGK